MTDDIYKRFPIGATVRLMTKVTRVALGRISEMAAEALK